MGAPALPAFVRFPPADFFCNLVYSVTTLCSLDGGEREADAIAIVTSTLIIDK